MLTIVLGLQGNQAARAVTSLLKAEKGQGEEAASATSLASLYEKTKAFSRGPQTELHQLTRPTKVARCIYNLESVYTNLKSVYNLGSLYNNLESVHNLESVYNNLGRVYLTGKVRGTGEKGSEWLSQDSQL